MTSKERLIAVSQGKNPGQQPLIGWPGSNPASDAVVFGSPADAASKRQDDKINLVEISNPFGLAIKAGVDLNHAQKQDPVAGGEILAKFVDETRSAIQAALAAGADGVVYKLYGATEQFCTPMQYGGYYLEIDRALLAEASAATFNLLYIVGDADTFIDFVSDLPAHAFAWDVKTTGFSVAMVRELRPTALCADDESAEIRLQSETGKETAAQFLTLQVNGSHV